jgi:RHS repeat-associated protein
LRDSLLTASTIGDTQSYIQDNAGRLVGYYVGGNLKLSYQYDAAGNRTRIIWPDTTFYVTTSYDALNRPTGIKELGTTDLATYAYDDLSRRATVTLGNGTTTTYGYNNQSALSSLAHNLAGTAQDNTWTYARNQAQEIVTNTTSNNAYQWAGYANGTRSYTANGLNQYTAATGATPAYDSNGNLSSDGTWTYTYDPDNRLRSANKTGQTFVLTYDGLDRLRRTVQNSVITADWLYDGTDMVGEYASGSLVRRYVHGPGIDEPLVWYEGSGTGSKTWLYADHQSSIAATANSAGTSTATYSYDPFGGPNVTTGIRFRYTGQQWLQELGLYYYKARFYSPVLGRFLQTDPVGYQSDLNLYAYVENNPINRTDPPGLFFVQVAAGGVNMMVGAIVSYATGQDITLSNLGTDFMVGALSGGTLGLTGKFAALAQITNLTPSKATTAFVGEVVKGIGDEQRTPGQTIGLAFGAAVLNATGVIGKTGAALATKSGLTVSSNKAANEVLATGFSAPAAVGAGAALETGTKYAVPSASAASMASSQTGRSSSLGISLGASTSSGTGLGAGPASQTSSIRPRK